MKTLIIGHRGAGKTSFAARTFGQAFVDLDDLLRSEGVDPKVFLPEREPLFRTRESEALIQVLEGKIRPGTQVVVAGAGAIIDDRSSHGPEAAAAALRAKTQFCGWQVIWVRRDSDKNPRLTLDRPRSEGSGPEGIRRRDLFYRLAADRVMTLPEGLDETPRSGCPWRSAERVLIDRMTSRPDLVLPITKGEGDPDEVLEWGARAELRDDLLSSRDLKSLASIFRGRSIISLRNPERVRASVSIWNAYGGFLDVPDNVDGPVGASTITSFHERREPLGALLGRATASLERRGVAKVAVEISDFRELSQGDAWASEDPLRRAFLPSSPDGRWGWYRMIRPGPLAFTRRGRGTCPDQPTIIERLAFTTSSDETGMWAAVIGDPVSHSRSPVEQGAFWSGHGRPFLRVRVPSGKLAETFPELTRMGMIAAAVTSPLKSEVPLLGSFLTERTIGSANTTIRGLGGNWLAGDVDESALREALAHLPPLGLFCSVWGGGALLPALKRTLPSARFRAVRTLPSFERELLGDSPCKWTRVVIWAGGPRAPDPPENWRPHLVLDLSYASDSHAAAWAKRVGAFYESGLRLFRIQAKMQRELWARILAECDQVD